MQEEKEGPRKKGISSTELVTKVCRKKKTLGAKRTGTRGKVAMY